MKMFLPVGSLRFTHLRWGMKTLLLTSYSYIASLVFSWTILPPSFPPSLSHSFPRLPTIPVEVEDEFHEAALEERQVPLSARVSHLVHSKHGPGMNRRINIAKLELIRWNTEKQILETHLTIGYVMAEVRRLHFVTLWKHIDSVGKTMWGSGCLTRDLSIGGHVPLPQEQHQLLFGKLRIHLCKWQHVERQVPRSILHEER